MSTLAGLPQSLPLCAGCLLENSKSKDCLVGIVARPVDIGERDEDAIELAMIPDEFTEQVERPLSLSEALSPTCTA